MAQGTYDVVVLGGGPGGSLTASLVRRQDPDRSVLVLERERFPRHHVGESTIPSWSPILERAGVLGKLREAIPIRKVGGRFLWGRPDSRSWTLDFRDLGGQTRDAGFHLDRAEFDALLLEHARSLGAKVVEEAAVRSVTRLDDGSFEVCWDGTNGAARATARHVVDATGQARLLSRLWKIPAVPYDGMNNYAIWAYWRGSKRLLDARAADDRERWTLISTCDDGWAWHIPIAPDLASVGLVTEAQSLPAGGRDALEAFYRRNVTSCPELGDLLTGAAIARHPRADAEIMTIRDWSYGCAALSGDGWFLVGDAALFVDPILSTGLLITSTGSSMAANALHTLWNDPDVDRELLRRSYDDTYREVGSSFHRLARIWYSRNFKRTTWHWEAKRQRLRAGGNPYAETSAQAFFQLCLGSFTDPIEGAFTHPSTATNVDRPDARIMAAHLFDPEERARVPGERSDEALAHPASETEARDAIRRASDERWNTLLQSRVRVKGCTWSRRESYFTNRQMDGWTRVAYVEVRRDGSTDPFERVVFPSWADKPEGILPDLDGACSLRVVVRACVQALPASERDERIAVLRRQVLQLDYGGWVQGAGGAPPEAVIPAPIAAALADVRDVPWTVETDLLGEVVTLRREGGDATIRMAPDAPGPAYKRTATTRLWHPGAAASPFALRLLDALSARLRAWETRDPESARQLWSRDVLSLDFHV